MTLNDPEFDFRKPLDTQQEDVDRKGKKFKKFKVMRMKKVF